MHCILKKIGYSRFLFLSIWKVWQTDSLTQWPWPSKVPFATATKTLSYLEVSWLLMFIHFSLSEVNICCYILNISYLYIIILDRLLTLAGWGNKIKIKLYVCFINKTFFIFIYNSYLSFLMNTAKFFSWLVC